LRYSTGSVSPRVVDSPLSATLIKRGSLEFIAERSDKIFTEPCNLFTFVVYVTRITSICSGCFLRFSIGGNVRDGVFNCSRPDRLETEVGTRRTRQIGPFRGGEIFRIIGSFRSESGHCLSCVCCVRTSFPAQQSN
jgi:hypothetical protein